MDYIMNYLKPSIPNENLRMVQLKYQYTNTNAKEKVIINPLPGDLVRKKSHCLKNTQICIHVYETTYSSFNKNVQ